MPTLNERLTKIEQIQFPHNSKRPAGMTDEQLVVHLCTIPERARKSFVESMTHEDLKSVDAVLSNHAASMEQHHAKP